MAADAVCSWDLSYLSAVFGAKLLSEGLVSVAV